MSPLSRKLYHLLPWMALSACGGALVIAASFYLYLSPKLPSVETLKAIKLQTPLRVYSQDLKLIGEFGEKRRTPIDYEDIPPRFIQALLAAEDDAFYDHGGVDINGLLRAAGELLTTGHIQTGGSTITMQVARNFFLTNEQSFIRKFNEILLALRIEDELSKGDILGLYANKIYLGNRAYGIEAAAQVYYGKSIAELDLPQLAMIAGLPKAPSAYNPLANPARALARRNWILQRMHKLGNIDHSSLQLALATPVAAAYHGPQVEAAAPYVAEMTRQETVAALGPAAYTDGYQVVTTIDSRLQQVAQEAVRQGLEAYDQRHGYRGPERHLDSPESWQATLAETPVYGNLVPAVVTQVEEQSLDLVLADGEALQLPWEKGLKNLRRFISPNRRSAPIKRADELFKPGDLVRIKYGTDGQWTLSQLPQIQGALVSLNPDNGAIQALVGGFAFDQSHFNRAVQAERQPGSNFKPFIYTRALETGMTAASIINDAPVAFDDLQLEEAWRPENDDGKFRGPMRLRQALYLSRNLVSIRILRNTGIHTAINGMSRFGFNESLLPRNLSLALGSHAMTPLTVATGYAVFANGGYKIEPYLVSTIRDNTGQVVYQAAPTTVCRDCDAPADQTAGQAADPPVDVAVSSPMDTGTLEITDSVGTEAPGTETPQPLPRAERVLDARVAYIMDSILKDVILRGTGKKARAVERSDIAGKTGTTNGPRDAWFSGYNPDLVTTVWVGFDENLLLGRREYGGSAALPIWIHFMREALAGKPERHRPQPDGLLYVRINPQTGERVGPEQPNGMFELFLKENAPQQAEQGQGSKTDDQHPVIPDELY